MAEIGSFDKIKGDPATYQLGGGEDAVVMAKRLGSVGLDIETAGLGELAWQIKAVVISSEMHSHILDPVADRAAITDVLEVATELVVHNAPFDVPLLVGSGMMQARACHKVYDTLVTARMAHPGHGSKALGAACERHLGEGYAVAKASLGEAYRALTGRSKSAMFAELGLDSDAYVSYAGFDGVMAQRLRKVLPSDLAAFTADHPYPRTDVSAQYLEQREQLINRALLYRACLGLEVDTEVLDQLQADMRGVSIAQARVLEGYGVETDGSAAAVKTRAMTVLDELGEISSAHKRLKSGAPSAAQAERDRISHPIIEAINLRSVAERFSIDYAEKLSDLMHGGRVHPQTNIMIARTGRMSIGTPPLQQYPPKVRSMLRFDQPVTSLDWSSIEPVYFANVAGESNLLEHFDGGGDLYQPIADMAGTDRTTAKVVLLAQLYGQGAPGLARRLGIEEHAAYELVGEVMATMPRIERASRAIRKASDAFGMVQTMSGRIVPQDPDPRTGNRRYKGYIGVNHYVQGSCYDLLAESIVAMVDQGMGDHLHLAVHDELIVSSEVADEVEHIMTEPPADMIELAGRVPVLRVGRAELGRSWGEKEQ